MHVLRNSLELYAVALRLLVSSMFLWLLRSNLLRRFMYDIEVAGQSGDKPQQAIGFVSIANVHKTNTEKTQLCNCSVSIT